MQKYQMLERIFIVRHASTSIRVYLFVIVACVLVSVIFECYCTVCHIMFNILVIMYYCIVVSGDVEVTVPRNRVHFTKSSSSLATANLVTLGDIQYSTRSKVSSGQQLFISYGDTWLQDRDIREPSPNVNNDGIYIHIYCNILYYVL